MVFKNQEKAEEYFWEKVARHNEDFSGLERWLDEQEITNDETFSEQELEDDNENYLRQKDYEESQGYPNF